MEWYNDWREGSKTKPYNNEEIEAVLFGGINAYGDRIKPALRGLYDAENNQIISSLEAVDWDEVVFWRSPS